MVAEVVARTWKLRLTKAQLEELAVGQWEAHAALTAAGYVLGAKSGFWRTSKGTVTGRLVYRLRNADEAGVSSIAVTIRGIPLQYA